MLIFIVLAVDLRRGPARHRRSAARWSPSGCSPRRRSSPASASTASSSGCSCSAACMSAFAGILLTLQNASVSYSAGTGLELNVVAIVLFGGVSIFGGRGTIVGVVLSVAIVGSPADGADPDQRLRRQAEHRHRRPAAHQRRRAQRRRGATRRDPRPACTDRPRRPGTSVHVTVPSTASPIQHHEKGNTMTGITDGAALRRRRRYRRCSRPAILAAL